MYERALRQDPNLLGACTMLAELVGREEKDGDRVARLFERSIRRDPKGAAGRFQRWAMVAVKDLDDRALARQLFERGRRDNPDDPYLTANLAWLLFEVGEDEQAIPLAKHALTQTDQPEIRLEAWFYLAAFGDPALAREARHRAEELIADGARSEGWDLSRIVARAKRESRDADWVERTAATIAGPAAADGGPT
jgi:tetratricopeptide (TPR) repeat protein